MSLKQIILGLALLLVAAFLLGVFQNSKKINTSLTVGGCLENVCFPGDVNLQYNLTNDGSIKIDRIKLSSNSPDKFSFKDDELRMNINPNTSSPITINAIIPVSAAENQGILGSDINFEFQVDYFNYTPVFNAH